MVNWKSRFHFFSNQNGRKRKDYPSKPEKNNYLDTSTSFKYGYETGGGYRSAAATPPSTESHHYKSYFLVTITMITQSRSLLKPIFELTPSKQSASVHALHTIVNFCHISLNELPLLLSKTTLRKIHKSIIKINFFSIAFLNLFIKTREWQSPRHLYLL